MNIIDNRNNSIRNQKIEVSILVCNYNPDWKKLERTLLSVIEQKCIRSEIIVCDDGSKNDYFNEITHLFNDANFDNYVLLGNKKNAGTVKNILNGLEYAQGEYIYKISPGDFLYHDITLYRLYSFAKDNHAKACFGDVIYYKQITSKMILSDIKYSQPFNPRIFDNCFKCRPYLFMASGKINGAAVFLERGIQKEYLMKLLNRSIYVEDNTVVAMHIYDNIKYHYFNDYIAFYESGTGISTKTNSSFGKRIHEDMLNSYKLMLVRYPNDKYLRAGIELLLSNDKIEKLRNLLSISPRFLFLLIIERHFQFLLNPKKANSREIDYSFSDTLTNKLLSIHARCKDIDC